MSTTDAAHHHIDDQTPSDSLHTEQNTITGSTPTISPTYITEFTPADLDAQDVSANQAYSAAAAALPTDNGPPTSSPPLPTSHIQFRSHTIAPSPPLPQTLQLSCSQQPGGADESVPSAGSSSGYQPSPLGSNTLKIQTDVAAIAPAASLPSCPTRTDSLGSTISGLNPSSARTANSNNGTTSTSSTYTLQHKTSSSSLRPVSRTPSFKSALGPYYGGGTSIGTASATSSAVPSPIISALGDVTPLPSPLLSSDSPGPWKRLSGHQRPPSREMHPYGSPQQSHYAQQLSQPSIMMSESVVVSASESKHKAHGGLKATQGVELGGESKPQEDARGQVQRLSPKQMQQKKQQQPHGRNRSVSEYVPEPLPVLARRHATVSAGPHAAAQQQAVVAAVAGAGNAVTMRREPHLSEARGLTSSTAAAVAAAASAAVRSPPTPPPSESSLSATDGTAGSAISKQGTAATTAPGSVVSGKDAVAAAAPEYFEAYSREDPTRLRRWRAMRVLGQGTFSTVVLATSMPAPPTTVKIHEEDEEMADARDGHVNHTEHEEVMARALTPTSDGRGASGSGSGSGGIDGGKPTSSPTPTSSGPAVDRKTLVAVKICEHGPRGGASEDRIEMSLKRELDIMRAIRHPSLVHLKAWNIEPTRAILVLSYCPGGDLFDVASRHRDVLQHPSLLRRVFAELVGAVRYLHGMRIVHRDIKLESKFRTA